MKISSSLADLEKKNSKIYLLEINNYTLSLKKLQKIVKLRFSSSKHFATKS